MARRLRERGLLDSRLVEETLQAYEVLARLRPQAQLDFPGWAT